MCFFTHLFFDVTIRWRPFLERTYSCFPKSRTLRQVRAKWGLHGLNKAWVIITLVSGKLVVIMEYKPRSRDVTIKLTMPDEMCWLKVLSLKMFLKSKFQPCLGSKATVRFQMLLQNTLVSFMCKSQHVRLGLLTQTPTRVWLHIWHTKLHLSFLMIYSKSRLPFT